MKQLKFYHWIILIAVALISFYLTDYYPPEFFDRFGLIVFSFLIGLSIWMLNTKKETNDSLAFITLAVSLAGLITDFFIVVKTGGFG